jgi:uncharacterized membrane protein YtjA (UPF0391 family)
LTETLVMEAIAAASAAIAKVLDVAFAVIVSVKVPGVV